MRSIRKTALVTGWSIVVMAIVALVVMGMVFSPLFELTNEELGVTLLQSPFLLMQGILGWVIILICDIMASVGLYRYYSSHHKQRAVLLGVLRLLYSVILLVAIGQLVMAYYQLTLPSVNQHYVGELVLRFKFIWELGLIIFGLHLIILGVVVYGNQRILKILGILLLIAGVGYFTSNVLSLIIIDYSRFRIMVEIPFLIPMIFGELGLAIYLLLRGGKPTSVKLDNALSNPA